MLPVAAAKPPNPGDGSPPAQERVVTLSALLIAVIGSGLFLWAGWWALANSECISRFFVQRVFWALALLPGIIAVSNLVFGVLPRRSRRRREVIPFVDYLAAASKKDSREDAAAPVIQPADETRVEGWEGLASPAAIVF